MQVNLASNAAQNPSFGSIVSVGKRTESALQSKAITRTCELFDKYVTDIIPRLEEEGTDFAIRCNGKDKLDFRLLESSVAGANAFARTKKDGWIGFTIQLPQNKADLIMVVEDACYRMMNKMERFLAGDRSSRILDGRENRLAKKYNRLTLGAENLRMKLGKGQLADEMEIQKLVNYMPKPDIPYEIIC